MRCGLVLWSVLRSAFRLAEKVTAEVTALSGWQGAEDCCHVTPIVAAVGLAPASQPLRKTSQAESRGFESRFPLRISPGNPWAFSFCALGAESGVL